MLSFSYTSLVYFSWVPNFLPYSNPILFQDLVRVHFFSVKPWFKNLQYPWRVISNRISVYTSYLKISYTNLQFLFCLTFFFNCFMLCSILFCIALNSRAKLIVNMYLLICRWMHCMEFQKRFWPKRLSDQLQLSSQSWVKGLGIECWYMYEREKEREKCRWPLGGFICHLLFWAKSV